MGDDGNQPDPLHAFDAAERHAAPIEQTADGVRLVERLRAELAKVEKYRSAASDYGTANYFDGVVAGLKEALRLAEGEAEA